METFLGIQRNRQAGGFIVFYVRYYFLFFIEDITFFSSNHLYLREELKDNDLLLFHKI